MHTSLVILSDIIWLQMSIASCIASYKSTIGCIYPSFLVTIATLLDFSCTWSIYDMVLQLPYVSCVFVKKNQYNELSSNCQDDLSMYVQRNWQESLARELSCKFETFYSEIHGIIVRRTKDTYKVLWGRKYMDTGHCSQI